MQLNISGIGMIQDATIDLSHLTVIAGENDTGKSTIGKVLFAITHGINNAFLSINKSQGDQASNMQEIAQSINSVLELEFLGQTLQQNGLKEELIEIKDKNNNATILSMKLDEFHKLQLAEIGHWNIQDATIIEGPSIFQYAPLIISVFDYHGVPCNTANLPQIPYHYVDLARKLQTPPIKQKEKLALELQNLIDAFGTQSYYLGDKQMFLHQKNTHHKSLMAGNVASGVKALSVIGTLFRAGYIHKNTILIFDGPETSLHPEWQIRYANIICKLADFGVKILVTTHSPYMLEAIKEFSKNNLGTKFYVSHRDESGFIAYEDTMGDITPLINALSQPLYDLINANDDF